MANWERKRERTSPFWAFGCNCICIWKHSTASRHRLLIGCALKANAAHIANKGHTISGKKSFTLNGHLKWRWFQMCIRQYKSKSYSTFAHSKRCRYAKVRSASTLWTCAPFHLLTIFAQRKLQQKRKIEARALIKRMSQSERNLIT